MNEIPQISMRAARVNANLSRKKAAVLLGLSESTLRNYEDGRTVPDVLVAKKISTIYGISEDFIFFGHK